MLLNGRKKEEKELCMYAKHIISNKILSQAPCSEELSWNNAPQEWSFENIKD